MTAVLISPAGIEAALENPGDVASLILLTPLLLTETLTREGLLWRDASHQASCSSCAS